MLCFSINASIAQVNYTARDVVEPYQGIFRPGSNLGYFPPWTDIQLANIAAGNPSEGVKGVGVKAIRPGLFESFVETWGYELRVPTFKHYDELGLKDNTLIVGFPSDAHRDTTYYCEKYQSELFANLYTPIWDNGENGTPYNDENYYAAYLFKLVTLYGKYVKFWEIWNEPGFDYTGAKGWQAPGGPGNWWDNDPDPCDYKLRAPIEHYVRILRISYEVIKTLDPQAYVCLSGTGYPSFLDAVLRNTDNPVDGSPTPEYPYGGGAYFDVMGFHSYPHFDGATREWSPQAGGFIYYRHSDAAAAGIKRTQNIYQDILGKYGFNGTNHPKKHWIITECNVPRKSFGEFLGSEEAQLNYILKAYVEAVRNNFLQLHIYSLSEQKTEANATFEFDLMGLYNRVHDVAPYQVSPTKAGIAYKTISDHLFGKTYDATRTAGMNLPSDVDGGAFRDDNGFYTYILWAKTKTDRSEIATATYSFPTQFNLFELSVHEWDFSKTSYSYLTPPTKLALNATPVILEESILTYKKPECAPTSVEFIGRTVPGAASWNWTLEGANPARLSGRRVSTLYSNQGNFSITLEIKDAAGNTITSQTDFIKVEGLPQADFTANVAGPLLTIENKSSENTATYLWNFGNGITSAEKNPTYTFSQEGQFILSLTAANECGISTFNQPLDIKLPAADHLTFNANDTVTPYHGYFRPGVNLGYFPPWTDEQLATIAAGDLTQQVQGIGAKAIRPALYGSFVKEWGYDFRRQTYKNYENLGLKDNTLIVGFPAADQRDPAHYCPSAQSEHFANLYMDIWDDGSDGTPINEENYYAKYIYELVTRYKTHVKFWEIWNEPGFDYTGRHGWLPPGVAGNWWENDPDPCHYKLRAPIEHFVRVLRISFEVIKSVDPEAYVVLSGTGYLSFLDAVLRNTDNPVDGSVTAAYPNKGGAYFDVMGFHSYPHFDGSTKYYSVRAGGFVYQRHSDAAADGIMRVRRNMQEVLNKHGYNSITYPNKLWTITECNIPRKNFNDFIGGDEVQRNFMLKAYVNAAANNFLQLHIYSLAEQRFQQDANYEFHLMGLYNRISGSKPFTETKTLGGIAYTTASELLYSTTFDAARTAALRLPNGIRGFAFKDVKGKYIYALWAETRTDNSEEAHGTFSFPSELGIQTLHLRYWDFSKSKVIEKIGASNITLTSTPIFLAEVPNLVTEPVAGFTTIQNVGCSPFQVAFTDVSKGANAWSWSFPGGVPSESNMQHPRVTYNAEGTYSVTLKVKNEAGEDEYVFQQYITIHKKPQVQFDVTIEGVEARFKLNQEPIFGVNYFWNFGNGLAYPAVNPTQRYQRNGLYEVTLVAKNEKCTSDTIRQTIQIAAPPIAKLKLAEQKFCDRTVASFVSISENDPRQVEWILPGGQPARSNAPGVVVIYRESGTYEALLIVTNEFGKDTISRVIQVNTQPITQIKQQLCEGKSIVVNGQAYNQNRPRGTERIVRAGTCDSLVVVDLTFGKAIITEYTRTLCPSEFVEINGNIYNEQRTSGIEVFPSDNACDSMVVINLIYRNDLHTNTAQILCAGERITFSGKELSISGTYSDTLISTTGCDSISNLFLTVLEPLTANTNLVREEINQAVNVSLEIFGGMPPYEIKWSNGATGAHLTGLPTGTYFADITDQFGCELQVEVTVGDGNNGIVSFNAYPNPVKLSEQLTLVFNSWRAQNIKFTAIEPSGRVVRSVIRPINAGRTTYSYPVPDKPGFYFIQLLFETGEFYTFTLIVIAGGANGAD